MRRKRAVAPDVNSSEMLKLDALLDRAMHAATPEQEARTCAWISVLHMRKLGMRPTNQKKLRDLERKVAELKSWALTSAGELRRAQGRVRELEAHVEHQDAELKRARSELAEARLVVGNKEPPVPQDAPPPKMQGRWIYSQYRGFCRKCKESYGVDSPILWTRGIKGALCRKCGNGAGA